MPFACGNNCKVQSHSQCPPRSLERGRGVERCERTVNESTAFLFSLDASNDKGEKVTKQVSFQQTDSLSVIVEIQSLENKGDRWRIHEKSQGAKVIDPKTRSSQSVKEQPCSNGHVPDTGSSFRRADHSVCEELGSDLPPWKRQILLNRKLKERAREKAEREKVDIKLPLSELSFTLSVSVFSWS